MGKALELKMRYAYETALAAKTDIDPDFLKQCYVQIIARIIEENIVDECVVAILPNTADKRIFLTHVSDILRNIYLGEVPPRRAAITNEKIKTLVDFMRSDMNRPVEIIGRHLYARKMAMNIHIHPRARNLTRMRSAQHQITLHHR